MQTGCLSVLTASANVSVGLAGSKKPAIPSACRSCLSSLLDGRLLFWEMTNAPTGWWAHLRRGKPQFKVVAPLGVRNLTFSRLANRSWATFLTTSTLVAASPALPAFGGDVRLGLTTPARGIQIAKHGESSLHPAGRTCPEDFALHFAFML